MKKHVIVFGLLFFSAVGFGQNVFPTASGSFVGIGTTAGHVKLDVRAIISAQSTLENLAFYGIRDVAPIKFDGLYVKHNTKVNGSLKEHGTILQFVSGYPYVTTFNKGFIEFNKPATTNTTISAMSFGSNDVEFMRINQTGKVRIGNGTNDLKNT